MKCSDFTKLFLLLILLNLSTCNKNKSRNKSKHNLKMRMHHKKSFNKNFNKKKNGPVTWDSLNDDLIEGFNTETTNQTIQVNVQNPKINSQFVENKPIDSNRYKEIKENFDKVPILSENQKSPTFRSVGPHQDSTVNYQGEKYSNIIRNTKNLRISPGFYGRSRLTRI